MTGWIKAILREKTIWILAIHTETKKIIGFISLLPREVTQKGRKLRGAIMGDFVVEKNYRVFGPGMSLVRKAVKYGAENDFDFIYTIPNKNSIKIARRAGFKDKITLITFVNPIDISYHLQKKMPKYIACIVTPLIRLFCNVFAVDNYTVSNGYLKLVTRKDRELDKFLKNQMADEDSTSGYYSLDYIFWRYSFNQTSPYHIFTYNNNSDDILGFFVVSFSDKYMEICDIQLKDRKYFSSIIKNLKLLAKNRKFRSIYFTVSSSSEWSNSLMMYGFYNTNYTMKVFGINYTNTSFKDWNFYQGDRNI